MMTPQIENTTAKLLDSDNLSPESEGNNADKINVKNEDDEDKMLTTAASVLDNASW